jgi:3-oxoacyl-[acyl-carrier protein] reductase
MHFRELKSKFQLHHPVADQDMTLPLQGKVTVVTGSTKGIGRATVLKLARAGAPVVINYSRDVDAATQIVHDLGKMNALAIQADAATVAGAAKIVAAAVDAFGKIDILIANAGILPMKGQAFTRWV